jgi:hypothetical protein
MPGEITEIADMSVFSKTCMVALKPGEAVPTRVPAQEGR